MAKAKLVTQGKISASRTPREMLYSILKLKKVAIGLLRMTTGSVEGEILICNATFVVGARLKNSNQIGYKAIRKLLMIKEGKFEYLDMGDAQLADVDQGLKVRLTQLINKLPELPSNYDELAGANTLNKIRAVEAGEIPTEEKLIDKDTFAQLAAWEESSMKLRGPAFWSTFAAVSVVVVFMYCFQR
jgi:hypothetical protein